ncbi:gamma carbonic anhydrase family protein, partial [Enterococcus faecalis]
SMIRKCSLVTEGKIIPPNVLVFGRIAKVICPLTAAEIARNHTNALHYIQPAEEFRQQK